MTIRLSETARQRVQQFLRQDPGVLGLRFGVKKVGCSGWSYVVDVARTLEPNDRVFEHGGVKVVVDAESLPMVDGTEIDFQRKGLNAEFVFHNPNVTAACGCGESFSVEKSAAF